MDWWQWMCLKLTCGGHIIHGEDRMETVKKAKPARCDMCEKKVGLTGFTCKCARLYCVAHRMPEDHACGFDHGAADKAALSSVMVACVGDKMGGERL